MKRRTFDSITLAALVVATCLHASAAVDTLPRTPCEGDAPLPAYAEAGAAPTLQSWSDLEWQPPACLVWPAARYPFVIAVTGRVQRVDEATLRRRIGAIATMRGLPYWSVTENASRVLIRDATALTAAEGARRTDFTADEIRSGAILHFVEEDNRSSEPVVYRMHVLEAGPDRIIVETANVTPISSFLVTLFPPDALRAAYILSRLEANTWGLYAVSVSTAKASNLVKLARASYANRARALYGHYAGEAPPGGDPEAPRR